MKPMVLCVALLAAASTAGCESGDGGGESGASAATRTGPGAASADSALRAMAGELLPDVVESSGLELHDTVRLARRTRAELEEYLQGELHDQLPPERAAGISATYRRLGLMPDTLDLVPFLRRLYLEQVAGYYDPERDTLYVVEGAPKEQLRTVLVHEMVHALQDQHVRLDSLTDAAETNNDLSQAIQAAVEGHATFVMTEWTLGNLTGGSVDLTTLPDLGEQLSSMDMAAAGGDAMPVLTSAPAIIRETLTFPYVDGMRFVQWLWKHRQQRVPPFGDDLPRSTEQVLHPEKLAVEGGDPPTPVRLADRLPRGWQELHRDGLGELEVRVFLTEHLDDRDRARRLASGWDGDLFVVARREDDAGPGPSTDGTGDSGDFRGEDALAWVSVWDSPAAADSFAAGAREAYANRYGSGSHRSVTVTRGQLDGRPVVRVVDLPDHVPPRAWRRLAEGARLEARPDASADGAAPDAP